ncbi:expressed unknown protein [Seminavis robusta]|uniref:Hedgehog protein Hint domain-containing protein n=1 Tax=Seminavis robusta TaxID=568900 RepID=A0A9N8DFJ9_9STRA|nr:expressed unknown protein [Seminavis robusta]|eukprot:Sro68_g038180.1 n/a (374) ;mRNA; r:82344-83735
MKFLLLLTSLLSLFQAGGACDCASLAADAGSIAGAAYGTYETSAPFFGDTYTFSLVYNEAGITGTVGRASDGASCTGSGSITSSSSDTVSGSITFSSDTIGICGGSASADISFDGSEFTISFGTILGISYSGTFEGDCSAACDLVSAPAEESVPSPAPSNACFAGDSTSWVKGRGAVAMEDLQVGDLVLDHTGTYQPIFTFGHYNPDQVSAFLQIHTNAKDDDNNYKPIEISPEHLIFLADEETPVSAGSVQVGDALRGMNGLVQTMNHHQIHMFLAPLRVFCLGIVSPTVCNVNNEEGVSLAVSIMTQTTQWAQSQSMLVQIPIAAAYGILLAVCFLLEVVFGPRLAPLGAMALCGGGLYLYSAAKRARKTV